MGFLYHFDVPGLRQAYGLDYFVETGTGQGDGLEYALRFGFKRCYSVEISPATYKAAAAKFANREASILFGSSRECLPEICREIPEGAGVLFWLDAHFPGHFETGGALNFDHLESVPLYGELLLLRAIRDISRDVILMDDLRIYEDGPYGNGNFGLRHLVPQQDAGFVFDILGQTHAIERDYNHEGYLVACPKAKTGGEWDGR